MKKITVESCGECPEYWRCQPAINDGGNSVREGFIYPNCPLENDEPSIPVSKIREAFDKHIYIDVFLDRGEAVGTLEGKDDFFKELESLIGEEEGEK